MCGGVGLGWACAVSSGAFGGGEESSRKRFGRSLHGAPGELESRSVWLQRGLGEFSPFWVSTLVPR